MPTQSAPQRSAICTLRRKSSSSSWISSMVSAWQRMRGTCIHGQADALMGTL